MAHGMHAASGVNTAAEGEGEAASHERKRVSRKGPVGSDKANADNREKRAAANRSHTASPQSDMRQGVPGRLVRGRASGESSMDRTSSAGHG